LLHVYDVAPEAISVAVVPVHTAVGPEMLIEFPEKSVRVLTAATVQPLAPVAMVV
jgi:hypothetical protein